MVKASRQEWPDADEDDSLRGVVHGLRRTETVHGIKERDADEPPVRWLLEAGLAAIEETYMAASTERRNAFMEAVDVRTVMAQFHRIAHQIGVDVGKAHTSWILGTRWPYYAAYQADLVRYIYRPALDQMRMRAVADTILPDLVKLPLGEMVGQLARHEYVIAPNALVYRVQTVLPLLFPKDSGITSAAAAALRNQVVNWARVYGAVMKAYGITQQIPLQDLAVMLSLVVGGGFQRHTAEGSMLRLSTGKDAVVAVVEAVLAQISGEGWSALASRRSVRPLPPLSFSPAEDVGP